MLAEGIGNLTNSACCLMRMLYTTRAWSPGHCCYSLQLTGYVLHERYMWEGVLVMHLKCSTASRRLHCAATMKQCTNYLS